MAEKKCYKCDAVLPPLARVCPECGARIGTGTGTELGLVLGLLVLAGAVVVVVKASTHAPKPAEPAPAAIQTVALQRPTTPATPTPPPAPSTPSAQPVTPPPESAPAFDAPAPGPARRARPQLNKGMSMDTVHQLWGAPVKEGHAQSPTTRLDSWTYPDGTRLHFINSVYEDSDKVAPPDVPNIGAASMPAMAADSGVAAAAGVPAVAGTRAGGPAGAAGAAVVPLPSIYLDGQASSLVVKHNASLDVTGSFTAELWVCLRRHIAGTPTVMTRDNPDLGPWEMMLSNGRLTSQVAGGNWSPTPPEAAYGPLPLGQWLHLAMVHDARQVRMYVNGKKVVQYAAPDRVKVTSNDLKIGRSPLNGQTLDGLVREVRISDSARYTDDFTPQWRLDPDGQTIVLLHCDEAKGRVARDVSGNGNDAEIINGRWVLP